MSVLAWDSIVNCACSAGLAQEFEYLGYRTGTGL
jgi:hypothetical protein